MFRILHFIFILVLQHLDVLIDRNVNWQRICSNREGLAKYVPTFRDVIDGIHLIVTSKNFSLWKVKIKKERLEKSVRPGYTELLIPDWIVGGGISDLCFRFLRTLFLSPSFFPSGPEADKADNFVYTSAPLPSAQYQI